MKFNLVEVLWWLFWMGIGFILLVGYEAYGIISDSISTSSFAFVKAVPFIGIIVFWALQFIAKSGGLVLYLIIQALEILWIVIYNSPLILQKILEKKQKTREYGISQNDGFWEKTTKRAYNILPIAIVRDCSQWAIGAYIIDFLVNSVALSPIKKGTLSDLFWVIGTGQYDQLNWNNILRIIGSLFILEIFVILLIQISRMRALIKEEEE